MPTETALAIKRATRDVVRHLRRARPATIPRQHPTGSPSRRARGSSSCIRIPCVPRVNQVVE